MKQSITSELTKTHIAKVLQELMLEKPINKITVKELAARAQINRQTFYYHFCDIYELLEWLLKKKLQSIVTNIEGFKSWQDAGIYLLNYLTENRSLVLATLNSMSRNTLKNLIYTEIEKIASKFVREIANGIKVSEQALNHIVHFFCVTFSALLEDWLVSENTTSPEDLIYGLDMIVSGMTRNALLRYSLKEGVL
ncbi:MAG: TetR/AcrR family transcriptional regulator C-terminal domain-containing protein [Eubacteriales bacterium]